MPKTFNPNNATPLAHVPSDAPRPAWSKGVPGIERDPRSGLWCSEFWRQGRGGLPVEVVGGVLVTGRDPVRAYHADYMAAQEAAQVRALMAQRDARNAPIPQDGYAPEVFGPDWRAFWIEAAQKARKLGRGAVRIATGIGKSMAD